MKIIEGTIRALNLVASWSKDKSFKCAAIIVDENENILGYGVNNFPSGVNTEIENRYERPTKYNYTEHAERDAIYRAAKNGIKTEGMVMYLNWFPCTDCARAIIGAGISTIIATEPDFNHPRYGESFRISYEMLTEAGVEIVYYKPEDYNL